MTRDNWVVISQNDAADDAFSLHEHDSRKAAYLHAMDIAQSPDNCLSKVYVCQITTVLVPRKVENIIVSVE